MKKKILTIILIILGLTLVLYFEIDAINSKNKSEIKIKVYFARKNIETNSIIKKEDLKYKLIDEANIEDDYCKEIENIVGKYSNSLIKKNEIVLKSDLLSNIKKRVQNKIIPFGKAQFTLELSAEEANGWQINDDDIVDLMFCSSTEKEESKRFFGVKVCSVLDENYKKIDIISEENRPKYLVLVSMDEDVQNILVLEDHGKFKVITLGK
ncbi:SAF domain-containing protein [Helicovermis profundi]|uniref:SAF domain-containing protein n=1 Tax=Helicovermis profundi TaxID=3065157 RepID=A0AAU9EFX6_9FIRM|nr:hypothetical protein HLPR_27550 [Clostridia bacterium S502]